MLKTYALAALLASAAALPLAAVAQTSPQSEASSSEHSQHHPAGAAAAAAGTDSGSEQTAPGQMAPGAGMPGQGGMMGSGGMMMGQGGMMDMRRMMEMMGGGTGGMPMMGMMGARGGMSMGMGGNPGGMPGMMFEHVEGRLAFLRTELGITEAQMPEWSAYAEAARQAAGTMRATHEKMSKSGMPATWPERLDRHEALLSARLEALRQTRQAASDLYASLSQEQKETADSLMMGPMGGM